MWETRSNPWDRTTPITLQQTLAQATPALTQSTKTHDLPPSSKLRKTLGLAYEEPEPDWKIVAHHQTTTTMPRGRNPPGQADMRPAQRRIARCLRTKRSAARVDFSASCWARVRAQAAGRLGHSNSTPRMPSKVLPLVHTTVVEAILRNITPSLDMDPPDRDTEVVDITHSNRPADKVGVWELPVLLLWVLVVVCLAVC